MNKLILLFFFLGTSPIFSQVSASIKIDTRVKIVEPIKIEKSIDLDFGNVISGAAPGTLVLSPQGDRIANGVAISTATPGNVSPAIAVITHGNNNYSVSLPESFTLYNQNNQNQSLIIDHFTVLPYTNSNLDGIDELKIGATLNLTANQVPGFYNNPSGFSVTVSYN